MKLNITGTGIRILSYFNFLCADNVSINIDGVLYLRIMDPYKASYGVEDPEFAITQLAQTTMRSELGKISLGEYRYRYCFNITTAVKGT
jgi:regulator of protease activity HflC (stomatin/prohibitin superfamily)